MLFREIIVRLESELKKPLPGSAVQLTMSSLRRIRELMDFSGQQKAVESSVLILLFPGDTSGSIRLVLMQRPEYDGVHSGQISLPGGKFEPADADLGVTALRETREETGADTSQVRLIGKLSDLYIPPSNYLVHPFVGYCDFSPDFMPDPKEVSKLIVIDLPDLLNDKNIRKKRIHLRNGTNILAPVYQIDGNTIWGATAMILSEFRAVARKALL